MNSLIRSGRLQRRLKYVNAGLLFLPLFFCGAFSLYAQDDAKSIMSRVYEQDTSHDATLRATLEITGKDGRGIKKKFIISRIGSFGNGKTIVRFTDPVELRGVKLLSVNKPGVPDQQWIYMPATERVRSISPREQSERFAGSDFTYEDIAEHPFNNFTYQLLPAEDVIENHKTSKIMATPTASANSQYKFIYYWVAQDVPCILHAEMYDEGGRKIREMHASGLRKVSGICGARKTEMQSLLDGTKSVLTIDEAHLNTGLDSAMFTPESLEKNEP
ncbi:MAG TPA: outer membrane lipoprotein-sorting protein [Candidatus Acidoferrales bacterium]|jgi:hypothetical protein|nr:outer membrane lipoprotein-sorting protein [Candidatus Acidoferrales bacterium]